MNSVGKDTTLTLLYDSLKGTYTWNPTNKQFIKTTNTTDIVFKFPSKSTVTTNDASLEISYTGIKGVPLISGYGGDVPASLTVTLSVSATMVAEFSMSASYSSGGIPSSVNGTIQLPPYKLDGSWTYSTSSVAITFDFLNGSNTLVSFSGTNTGNFSKITIDTAKYVGSILKTANSTLTVGNIGLAGYVNAGDLSAKIPLLEAGTNADSVCTQEARLLNNDVSLVLYYVNSNQKIASTMAYVIKSTIGMSTTWQVQMEFEFADKSKGTFDSYYGDGFSNSLQQIFQDLGNTSTN
jgi:hypothetical protein